MKDLDNAPSQAVCRIGLRDEGVVEKWYDSPSRMSRLAAEEYAARP
jgi:hypothetical protein